MQIRQIKTHLNDADRTVVYANYHYHKVDTKTVRKKGRFDIEYESDFMTFDCETSHINESLTWVYQWAFMLNNQIVVGRSPVQFIKELLRIKDMYQLNDKHRQVIYIHNLSYDLTYIIDYMSKISDVKCLCLDSHKFLTAIWNGFEFRCSYLLSNMSLEKYCILEKTKVKKAVGTIDYDIIRYQDTNLTYNDWYYQINDVVSQHEAIENNMLSEKDNVATIPLTSTGYVRRDCRKACRSKHYRDYFIKSKLDVKMYKTCREEFGGGLTHGNRFLSGKIIKGDIGHYDYKSHYPSIQQMRYFPDKWHLYYDCEYDTEKMTKDELIEICKTECVLFKAVFENLKLKDNVTCPVISKSHILNKGFGYTLYDDRGIMNATDNGRIINADGIIMLSLTELDFALIDRQYNFDDIIIKHVYISKRIEFPREIKQVIDNYFYMKETELDEFYRKKIKNKINAIYGMTATNIVRDDIEYIIESHKFNIIKSFKDERIIETKLDKYYKSRNSFMPYQLGIYTTSWARYLLVNMIEYVVGYENFIYCDTDSIFFIKTDEIVKRLKAYNDKIISDDIRHIDANGKKVYYGLFEDEKDNIKEFKFLHAKCYAFVDSDNQLHVTIAGVAKDNKKLGKERITIEDELKNLDNLHEGFTFVACGGTRAKYTIHEPCTVNINGHMTELASGCIVLNVTKTLSELENYEIYEAE